MIDWTVQVPGAQGLDPDALGRVPGAHGVVCIVDRFGAVLALTATANMRSWCADRLGPDAEGARDLRSVAAGVRCVRCCSLFESDLTFLGAAAELDPVLHRSAQRKLAVWWLGIDPGATPPRWSPTDEPDGLDCGMVALGPFVDRASARQHAEWLDDRFELCRFPEELAKAPHGKACLYKDMGRCPAACDGSEPIEHHRRRLQQAIDLRQADVDTIRCAMRDEMDLASRATDFDRAARVKESLSRLDAIDGPKLAALDALDRHAWAVLTKAENGRAVRVLAVVRGRWRRVGDVEVADADGFEMLASEVDLALGALAGARGVGDVGVLGVLGRALMKPGRSGLVFVHQSEISGRGLLLAAEGVTRIRSSGDGSRGKGK